MLKEFSVTVDIEKHINNPVYTFSTSDWNSLKFLVTVQKNGTPANLTGIIPRIAIVKKDKTTILQDGTVTDAINGKCEFLLTSQAYVVGGIYKAEVMLYEGAQQVAVASGFTYTVSIGVMNIDLESSNDWPTLSKAIEAGENETARITAESDRLSAETTRIANETTREVNESTRQENEASRQTNTAAAITNAEQATADANSAASFANEQADRAKAEADRLTGTDVSVLDNKIGPLANLTTTKKTSVVEAINENTSQLAQIATVDSFSGANDTMKFYNACANAVANKKVLRLTKDITLDASIQNQFEIPSIEGSNYTITVVGALKLNIGSMCNFIKDLKIFDTNSYLKTDFVGTSKTVYDKGFLFETKAGYSINGLEISNIRFNGGSECADGSRRTKGVFYLKGDNLFIKEVSISDSRCGFCINDADGTSVTHYDVHFGNIAFFNTEQGIWANRTGRIFVDNVSMINTLTQQGNSSIVQGSDPCNFLYCSNIEISNFYSNYTIERSIYFIYCNNINVNGFVIENTGGGNGGGIKFLGILNVGSLDQPTTNIKVTNGTFTGNGRESCFELYNSKYVEISNITVNATSGKFGYFAQISNNSKDISIHHCNVQNLDFNFIYGVLISTLGGNTLSHLYDTLSITDCYIVNPVSITAPAPRNLIEFYNPENKNLSDETFFKFYNFTFKNNKVIQTLDGSNIYVKHIEPTSKLEQLTSNIRWKHVRYENNQIRGCNSQYGFIYIDPNSEDVVIIGDYAITNSISMPHSSRLYCSSGSEINFIISDTTGLFKNKAIYNNVNVITKSSLNNISDIILDYSPANSEVKYLFYTENGTRLYSGYGEIFFEDGLYSKFKIINNAGNLTIAQISGDGTVSSNNLTFANGSQIEFGPTYKELRIRSGSTAKKYTVVFKAKV